MSIDALADFVTCDSGNEFRTHAIADAVCMPAHNRWNSISVSISDCSIGIYKRALGCVYYTTVNCAISEPHVLVSSDRVTVFATVNGHPYYVCSPANCRTVVSVTGYVPHCLTNLSTKHVVQQSDSPQLYSDVATIAGCYRGAKLISPSGHFVSYHEKSKHASDRGRVIRTIATAEFKSCDDIPDLALSVGATVTHDGSALRCTFDFVTDRRNYDAVERANQRPYPHPNVYSNYPPFTVSGDRESDIRLPYNAFAFDGAVEATNGITNYRCSQSHPVNAAELEYAVSSAVSYADTAAYLRYSNEAASYVCPNDHPTVTSNDETSQ
jgi:hypothetical protein